MGYYRNCCIYRAVLKLQDCTLQDLTITNWTMTGSVR